jgi:hypothetical protein
VESNLSLRHKFFKLCGSQLVFRRVYSQINYKSETEFICGHCLVQRFTNSGACPPAPPVGAVGPLGRGGGGQVVCVRGTFILKKVWAQGKICILVCTLLVEI